VPKKITEASLMVVRQGLLKSSVKPGHVVKPVISVFVGELTPSTSAKITSDTRCIPRRHLVR
jgi:hypothetical protein